MRSCSLRPRGRRGRRRWRVSRYARRDTSSAGALCLAHSAQPIDCKYGSARRRVGSLLTKGSRLPLAFDHHHRPCCVGRPWLLWPWTLFSVAETYLAPAGFKGRSGDAQSATPAISRGEFKLRRYRGILQRIWTPSVSSSASRRASNSARVIGTVRDAERNSRCRTARAQTRAPVLRDPLWIVQLQRVAPPRQFCARGARFPRPEVEEQFADFGRGHVGPGHVAQWTKIRAASEIRTRPSTRLHPAKSDLTTVTMKFVLPLDRDARSRGGCRRRA